MRLSVRVSFRFRPLLRPFKVGLAADAPLLCPFRFQEEDEVDEGLAPRVALPLTGRLLLPFADLLWLPPVGLLLPLTGLLLPFTCLLLPMVRPPLLEPLAE